jgi:ferredoxin-NADP reductase
VPPLPRRLAAAAPSLPKPGERRVPRVHDLRVAEVRRLTDDAVCVTFDVPDELRNDYWFAQGQSVVLVHRDGDEELRRSYSICAPAGTGPLRVAIKRQEGGRVSTWAATALAERSGGRLEIHHAYSREPWPDGRPPGRLDAAALAELFATTIPAARHDEWLLCGPAELVRAATDALVDAGVPARAVHRELFADDGGEPDGALGPDVEAAVTVVLDGRRTDLVVRSSGPAILDALLPERPEAPYSCREGVCSTCRCLVVYGEVTMRRSSGLDAAEKREGYVLACQAHPATERVVLDFDA